MNKNEIVDLIKKETTNDWIQYSCGDLTREEMNINLLERRKLLSLVL